MQAFNWPKLMAAGIRHLGLMPDEFWALTPAELSLMLGASQADQAMSRGGLAQLMRIYPDQSEGQDDG